ncbi:hypothetical protein D030_2994A, partial [Vibrio parahaemolyticus AQ3810]|jgi:hypothetical protein
MNI